MPASPNVSLEIDESEFPLIAVTFQGQATAEDWAELTAVIDRQFELQQHFVIAVRTLDFKLPEIALLKQMGAWTRDHERDVRRYLIRSRLCIPSAMARGAGNFINRVSGSKLEQAVFADWDETLAWAREGVQEQAAAQ